MGNAYSLSSIDDVTASSVSLFLLTIGKQWREHSHTFNWDINGILMWKGTGKESFRIEFG